MPATLFYLSYRALIYLSIVMRMRILENIHMREQNFHSHMYATWLSFTNKLQIHCSAHEWTDIFGVRSGTKSILRFRGLGNTSSLRKIVCCPRGVGSMSSSRRIPRFIVLRGTAGFLRGVAIGLYRRCESLLHFCLRVVGSSFRRMFRYIIMIIYEVPSADVWSSVLWK